MNAKGLLVRSRSYTLLLPVESREQSESFLHAFLVAQHVVACSECKHYLLYDYRRLV